LNYEYKAKAGTFQQNTGFVLLKIMLTKKKGKRMEEVFSGNFGHPQETFTAMDTFDTRMPDTT